MDNCSFDPGHLNFRPQPDITAMTGNSAGCYGRRKENYVESWTTSQRFHKEMTHVTCAHIFLAKASFMAISAYKGDREMQSNHVSRGELETFHEHSMVVAEKSRCLGKVVGGGAEIPSQVS